MRSREQVMARVSESRRPLKLINRDPTLEKGSLWIKGDLYFSCKYTCIIMHYTWVLVEKLMKIILDGLVVYQP
jgi:hypothetical protein